MKVSIDKEQILEAAKTSSQAKKALEKLFPSVFEDNRLFCYVGSVFLRSACPNSFYTIITQGGYVRLLNISHNTFWKSVDNLKLKRRDLKLGDVGNYGAITHTEMREILGVKSLEDYTVITTDDIIR